MNSFQKTDLFHITENIKNYIMLIFPKEYYVSDVSTWKIHPDTKIEESNKPNLHRKIVLRSDVRRNGSRNG